MLDRISIVSLAFVALSVQVAVGLELIEMSDANKNAMNMDLSKALGGVQEAYKNGFKFESGKDINTFLVQCEHVKLVTSKSDDSDFGGLARQIKAIIADESIARPCSAKGDFKDLDEGLDAANFDYLTVKTFNKLVQIQRRMDSDEAFRTVAQHLFQLRVKELSETLMRAASDDVSVYLGEVREQKDAFDFDVVSKRLCETSQVEPICKLVRRSSQHVTVVASDFDEFAQLVRANDVAKLNSYAEASGVPMEQLKKNCQTMLKRRVFKPIEMIRNYVSSGFIGKQQVAEHMKEDTDLASYSSLYELCQLVN